MVVSGWGERLFFMHGLVGIADMSQQSSSFRSFTWDIGGGLDVPINRRTGWRAIQIDYRQTNPASIRRSEIRFTTGLTFAFKRFVVIE